MSLNMKDSKNKKHAKNKSESYRIQRQKANIRKRRFLDKLTAEQKELIRAKNTLYYHRKKLENKTKCIIQMSESDKREQRKIWRRNSQKYRHKKRELNKSAMDGLLEIKNKSYTNSDAKESIDILETRPVIKEEESNHSNSDLGSLWNHFEQLSRSRARCTMCKLVIDILDMQDHLRTKHPKVSSEEHDLDSGTEAQNNGEEETYTEIIYLDENFSQNKPKTYENPLKKRKSEVIYKSKSNKMEKTDNDDELDKFLTYISCLMKNMPKDVTDVLQMEIINLIMKEKIKLTQKQAESNHLMNVTLTTPSTTNNLIVVTNDNLNNNAKVDNIVTSFKND